MSKRIFVMGIGWSGSSSVVDFLYQNDYIVGVTGDYPEESKLLTGSESPLFFMNKFSGRGMIDFYGFLALVTGGRLGLNKSKYEDELIGYFGWLNKSKSRIMNSRNFIRINDDELVRVIEKYFPKNSVMNNSEFNKVYPTIIKNLMDFFVKKEKVLCYNQDPNFFDLTKVIFKNNDYLIVVIRNPKDIIADNPSLLQDRPSLKRIAKVSIMALNLRKIFKQIKIFQKKLLHKNLIVIKFENFIKKDRSYFELVNFLELEKKDLNTNGVFFDRENSHKNINIAANRLGFFESVVISMLCEFKYINID